MRIWPLDAEFRARYLFLGGAASTAPLGIGGTADDYAPDGTTWHFVLHRFPPAAATDLKCRTLPKPTAAAPLPAESARVKFA